MVFAGPAAADCGGDFSLWLEALRKEGLQAGISVSSLDLLDGVKHSAKVLALDQS
jgi:membrane-bound lytic murein transglycosylase B